MRLNWFSPLPPARSGIADYTMQLLPALTWHVMQDTGTLAEHLFQLFREPLADSSWSDRRLRLPWEIFAELMRRVGGVLRGLPNAVRVEGHTDDTPIHTPRFTSNWDLSTARATEAAPRKASKAAPAKATTAKATTAKATKATPAKATATGRGAKATTATPAKATRGRRSAQ